MLLYFVGLIGPIDYVLVRPPRLVVVLLLGAFLPLVLRPTRWLEMIDDAQDGENVLVSVIDEICQTRNNRLNG